MAIYRYADQLPTIDTGVYVAETADVIGQVTLKRNASVWYQAVLRGDTEHLEVGENSNIQDGAVLHADPGFPLVVGDEVTVGHQAMLHGCKVGDGSLVGIQAIILNGAEIGKNCLVAAGALIKEGATFPDNSLIVGAPARVVRELSAEAIANLKKNAEAYVQRGRLHAQYLERVD
ncbi:gamma carbonic anhydrase family protein [Modicisalibacter radicis]|uniref:gamma carbonic anhydrase family protein n=1 Tax=Halomonas sp. EAR18 TaxID=2518972 RepID=UPI00109C3097|nr:gamma carbonic anhydrase family protein [Halomonas sp. EAR18]